MVTFICKSFANILYEYTLFLKYAQKIKQRVHITQIGGLLHGVCWGVMLLQRGASKAIFSYKGMIIATIGSYIV